MGKMIVWANPKGGSAKSTSAHSAAAAAMLCGRGVRLVDLDVQASLTQTILGPGRPSGGGAGDLLAGVGRAGSTASGAARGWAAYPVAARIDGWLELVAADDGLARWERGCGDDAAALEAAAANLRAAADGADIAMVDTPGTVGPALAVALLAADLIVSPVGVGSSIDLDPLGDLRALRRQLLAKGLTPPRVDSFIVPTDYREREAAQREGLADLRAQTHSHVLPAIPHSALVSRAINDGTCVVLAHPQSAAAAAYRALIVALRSHLR